MVVYRIGKRSSKSKSVDTNRLDRMYKLSIKSLEIQSHFFNNFLFNFKDIRMTSFGRLSTILDSRRTSYLMISQFQKQKLSQKKYRKRIFDSKITIYGDLDALYRNSISDLKRGFFLDIFQTFESTLRLLNLGLGNNNVSGLNSILKNIFQKTGLSAGQKKRAKELLGFISIIRNSIHNNGVYLPIHDRTTTFPIKYRGVDYTFHTNDIITLNFEILFNVTEDVIDVLKYIISDSTLNSQVVNSTHTLYRNTLIEDKTL